MKLELHKDISIACDWIIECFSTLNLKLDYTIDSLKSIDKFIQDQTHNGKPRTFGILKKYLGKITFALGCYLGEVIKKEINGLWYTNDDDPSGEINIAIVKDNSYIFPVQRIMKRIKGGNENNIYDYAKIIIEENKGNA